MSIDAILQQLYARTTAGIKPGLERTFALLESVGNPHLHLPVIHVAGTNGKGSTCAALASVLQRAGYRTGLYTSPHIVRFNERLRIDGLAIGDADVARLASLLLEHGEAIGSTFFEITTVMALQWFAERRVDVAIIETGLGGRWDSTNVVTPLASVVTSIDMDHMEYLGNTLESIAAEKAGIIKPGVPAVIGEPREALRHVFAERAADVGAPCLFLDDVMWVELDRIHPDLSMTVSIMTDVGLEYGTTDLCGIHQVRNVGCALATLRLLADTYHVSREHVALGLQTAAASTGLRGRTEVLDRNPFVVLDVAHNPAGMAALIRTLTVANLGNQPWHVVFGAFADKEVDAMLSLLAPITKVLYACAASNERAMPSADVANRARTVGIMALDAGSVQQALATARGTGNPVLVCGSFSVAEEVLTDWR
jgi:dihydrofolate synthase/folylpolyglutamate synthase